MEFLTIHYFRNERETHTKDIFLKKLQFFASCNQKLANQPICVLVVVFVESQPLSNKKNRVVYFKIIFEIKRSN